MELEEDKRFVERHLVEEMMYDKCFSEEGSREFVELGEVVAEPLEEAGCEPKGARHYRARATVLFSGLARHFRLRVKLLPEDASPDSAAFVGLANEEVLFNNTNFGMRQFGSDVAGELFPRVYLADMGRYGRPAIVLEDPAARGFSRALEREPTRAELAAAARKLGRLHGRAMALRELKPSVFRQFYAKFEEVPSEGPDADARFAEFVEELRAAPKNPEDQRRLLQLLGRGSLEEVRERLLGAPELLTICQGLLVRENLWFRTNDDDDATGTTEALFLNWHRVKRGSCALDLATLLAQSAPDHWDGLVREYLSALEAEGQPVDEQLLRREVATHGFLYALYLSCANATAGPPVFFLGRIKKFLSLL